MKFRTRLLVALLALLLPFLTLATVIFALPPVYQNTFVGELGEKYDRLTSIKEPKIVVLGGSSVAFGLDSAMMEAHLGMPVVNFGLYANFGTRLMLDLSRPHIGEGDIVILAPEMNAQTLSLYFNAGTLWQALDGYPAMLRAVDGENIPAMLGTAFRFAADKLGYLVSGDRPQNTGAYAKEYFNEYGDNVYDRPYNITTGTIRSISLDFFTEDDGVTTDYEAFVAYLNTYIDDVTRAGATVYYSFCPMNAQALTEDTTPDTIFAYYQNLRASLHCRVISNINDYIMEEGYFFDSALHLNNAGVTVRTVRLIDDVKRERGDATITMPEEDLPAAPGFRRDTILGEEEENLYFLLRRDRVGGEEFYTVTGLNPAGLSQRTLKIPDIVDGLPVRTVATGALTGGAVRELTLGLNVSRLDSGALGGASSLRAVHIPDGRAAENISVPNQCDLVSGVPLMTDGAPDSLKIYVDAALYEGYLADYSWQTYGAYLASRR